MEEIISFFESLIEHRIEGIEHLIFGDEEDLLASLRNKAAYPCLFVSEIRKTFDGVPEDQLYAIYEVKLDLLMPNEKGNYAQRIEVWKRTEKLMDKVLANAADEFSLDWTSFRVDWFAGYTSSNLAGVQAVLPIKIFQNSCL